MLKKSIVSLFIISVFCVNGQQVKTEILLEDRISIRALEIWDHKVWYSGTESKFGYVSLVDARDKKQMVLSDEKLQFRTLGQNKTDFYAITIESPALMFKINKRTLAKQVVLRDTAKTAFYDALHFVNDDLGYAFSDPDTDLNLKLAVFNRKGKNQWYITDQKGKPKMNKGEAAFAASNSNMASSKNYLWIASGGATSRIFRLDLRNESWSVFNTPFIQGSSSQGIYAIDFYKDKFGIAVGGDYTKQTENINNIATTIDGGQTWTVQASGKNGGYKSCVKIRPRSGGKDIIAVSDQNVELSRDFGKTWTTISNEKGLYVCEWTDRNTIVLAGKERILRMSLEL